jgi:hypothetical protein
VIMGTVRSVAVVALVLDMALASRASAAAGAPFLNLGLSVRQAGMGDVSVGGDDVLRVWSNPALLASQRARAVIGLNGSSLFDGVQQTFGAALGWRMAPRLVVGGLVSAYTVGFREMDATGVPGGTDVVQRSMAGGIAAASRWRWLAGGATVKYVAETGGAGEVRGPAGFAADVGLSSGWRGWTMAVAARNLGAPLRSSGMAVSLPSEQRLGLARGFPSWKLLAAVEYVNSRVGVSGAGAGAEWRVGPAAVRLGASGIGGGVMRFSCGLSAVIRAVGIDYALVTHPLGFTHRFSVMLGWGAVETAPQVYKVREITEEELYESGSKLYAAGRYDDAIRQASELTRLNPRNWQAWQLLGNCVYAKGDREGALQYYRYSLTINPGNQQLKSWLEQTAK